MTLPFPQVMARCPSANGTRLVVNNQQQVAAFFILSLVPPLLARLPGQTLLFCLPIRKEHDNEKGQSGVDMTRLAGLHDGA